MYIHVIRKMPEIQYEFQIFHDSVGQRRFRLVAGNHEIVSASEGYSSRRECLDTICSIKKRVPSARIVDLDIPSETLTCE